LPAARTAVSPPCPEEGRAVPTLPWTTVNAAAPDAEALVMASRLEVRSFSDVPRFFLRSLATWKQVRSAPGAYGASLIAQPLKRTFWTLSAWEDKEALYRYARTEPHRSVMSGLRSTMSRSVFTFWQIPAADLPLDWAEARRRLAEQERADAQPAAESTTD
jgi:heme-degrading monooxygenase HmoA